MDGGGALTAARGGLGEQRDDGCAGVAADHRDVDAVDLQERATPCIRGDERADMVEYLLRSTMKSAHNPGWLGPA